MEYIKKKILQATTTGTTTGCTGTCRVIIPDTGATYCIIVGLVQDAEDIGFFDAYDFTTGVGIKLPYIIISLILPTKEVASLCQSKKIII